LRKINGIIKKLGKRKPNHSDSSSSNSRYCCLLAVLWIGGCTSLKKAALVGTAGLAGVSVGSALGLATAPTALVTAVAASATSVVADQVMKSPTLTGNTTLNNCAETNFWDVVGQLIEMGGWLLILVVLIPMVLGWILPGPLERKKKK
tara:strand:- start:2032 stop:2475 length:444 start_codon:yes stop_codon:yes gene_type:complete